MPENTDVDYFVNRFSKFGLNLYGRLSRVFAADFVFCTLLRSRPWKGKRPNPTNVC